ncbi:djbp [Cyclophragma undans nucleopolyhedrovirus]|uniref:Djbp n=1 Tax=Cyclophragma undans nucleopolyhedrovirus TaxID=1906244 RepID=A0A288Q7K0_9ABAC|nr:djbp [Cyclophragma undans nucleopolyhedrovirus]AOT85558.1 djbp [Cyclophragma undans nucleopolyhedrovirus]
MVIIGHARSTLIDLNRKKKYDHILNYKLLAEKANFIVESNGGELMAAVATLKQNLEEFFNSQSIDDAQIATFKNVANEMHIALNSYVELNKSKIVRRPATLNRIDVKWTLTTNQKEWTREEIKNHIKDFFEQYGEIIRVFVFPDQKNHVIVHYASFKGVESALSVNNYTTVPYTVTELTLLDFNKNQLINLIEANYKKLLENFDKLKDAYK